jgi:predicted transcriptional regulator
MSAHSEFVSELTNDITHGATNEEWHSVRADLSTLAEQIVQALIDRRDQDVSRAYQAVESAYSTLLTKSHLEDNVSDAKSVVGELRAYTRLLSLALQYRRAPALRETALDSNYRPLLEALLRAPHGMSGRELAERLNARPETIARKLPILRSANLVRSQQAGKATINTLTAEGRALLDRESAKRAMSDLLEGKVVAAKKVSLGEGLLRGVFRSPKRGDMRRRVVHEVKVIGASPAEETKDIAGLIVEEAKGLARINEAVAEKVGPTEDLTIHFYPSDGLVVANLDPKQVSEAATARSAG